MSPTVGVDSESEEAPNMHVGDSEKTVDTKSTDDLQTLDNSNPSVS